MTVLSDNDIAHELGYGDLDISPVNLQEQLQPNSLDIRLGNEFSVFHETSEILDASKPVPENCHSDFEKEEIIIHPGEFVLGTTVENVTIPDYLYGELHGRSSVARLGVEVHSTGGVIDSGYSGEITLEMQNKNQLPVKLPAGMRVGQIVFYELKNKCNKPYSAEDNKYQEQEGVVHSRISEEL